MLKDLDRGYFNRLIVRLKETEARTSFLNIGANICLGIKPLTWERIDSITISFHIVVLYLQMT